jgi:hypothetical protein
MKHLIVPVLAAFVLAITAQASAGNPNLCSQNGWATAQAASGTSFVSMKECAKAREVFQPSLSISPTHVGAGEQFTLIGRGFHPSTSTIVSFAITGQTPYAYYIPYYGTFEDGSFTIPFVFAACGNSPDDLTITLIDSFGVHASARLTLC